MPRTVAVKNASPSVGAEETWRRHRVVRSSDVVIAYGLILFTLPLLALIGLAIRYDSPGPIFVRQERGIAGYDRVLLLGFRTTQHLSANESNWCHGCMTRMGELLRFSRLEYLPRLFNVARGDIRWADFYS